MPLIVSGINFRGFFSYCFAFYVKRQNTHGYQYALASKADNLS